MTKREKDGSAGAADYGKISVTYSDFRQPDPRIQEVIEAALGTARTVITIGAGAGSYEPKNRDVTPIEPSQSMRSKRPADLAIAIDAVAEDLPFADNSFDAAMTTFSVHQWGDLEAGLSEMRRVARGPVVILTCNPDQVRDFWLYEYCPEALDAEARRFPSMSRIAATLGPRTRVESVPIPLDCSDGFNEAYFGRPEMFLRPEARLACSAWSFVDTEATERFERRLRGDLDGGIWDRKFGPLREQTNLEGSLVLVTAEP